MSKFAKVSIEKAPGQVIESWINLNLVQRIERVDNRTQVIFQGGGSANVAERPEDIVGGE